MLDRTNMTELARLGHNKPPTMLEQLQGNLFAPGIMSALADFLDQHPVIQSEDDARAAKALKDRADLAVKDLEDERDALVRPLNAEVKEINDRYRPVRDPILRIIGELKGRLNRFFEAETKRRAAIAEAAARIAAEKEMLARRAEEAERLAAEEAAQGVCDVDMVGAVVEADTAFAAFEKAGRESARAERDSHVRIGGGYGRALSSRSREVLTVTNWHATIEEMGLTGRIYDAIVTSAKDYRKAAGELPAGITATRERSV